MLLLRMMSKKRWRLDEELWTCYTGVVADDIRAVRRIHDADVGRIEAWSVDRAVTGYDDWTGGGRDLDYLMVELVADQGIAVA